MAATERGAARDDRDQSPNQSVKSSAAKQAITAALLAGAALPAFSDVGRSDVVIAPLAAPAATASFSEFSLPHIEEVTALREQGAGEQEVAPAGESSEAMSTQRRGQTPANRNPSRSNTYGSTWQQDSKALKQHNAIQEKIRTGSQVEPQEIEALFTQVLAEPSTRITGAFVRSYAAGFKDDASSIAMLDFLYKASYLTGSPEFLRPFYSYENPKVVLAALRVAGENPDVRIDQSFLTPFQQHSHSAVRAQALAIGMAKRLPVTNDNPFDIARAAEGISAKDLLRGYELRFGLLMGRALEQLPGQTLGREELRAIQMPVLRTLREIDEAYPGYLDKIDKNPVLRSAFVQALVEIVANQRQELSQRVLFGEDVKLLSILHEEACFSHARITDYARRFGVDDITIFKGVAKDKLSPKGAYLEEVREISKNGDQQALIWNCGHGGPQHFWLRNGQAGVHVSDKLRDPRAISYLELAEALVLPQVNEIKQGDAHSIDLGHVTLLYDACFQYNMAENFYRAVYALAAEHKVDVTALPLLVTASQNSMYGWVYKGDVNRSFLQQALHDLETAEPGVFRVGDLFATDRILSEAYLVKLGDRASYTEVQNGEDLAIFSGKLLSTGNLMGLIYLRGLHQGHDFGGYAEIDLDNLDARHRIPEVGKGEIK